ncbi:MAG: histidinol dehydrogenase [Candidatus Nitrosocaldaceae archaeon]
MIRRVKIDEIEKIRRDIISDEHIRLVKEIIDNVIKDGDKALLEYSKKFENVLLDSLLVSKEEISDAYSKVSEKEIEALKEMKRRVKIVEEETLNSLKSISIEIDGIRIERYFDAIESVGWYIPGGKARYPSSVIMCTVPARVAGVKRIVLSTPSSSNGVDPLTLVAADLCNVDEIYKIGGAQAIAAMAYGSESIKPVDKIVGPGGIFVTIAKYLVSNKVSIDMLAGPTELLVLADDSADAKLIAYDLIAQAEHSNDTLCGLVTTSKILADNVEREINARINDVKRSDIIKHSLTNNGFIVVCDENSAIRIVNTVAPEHLEIFVSNADKIIKEIRSAGLVLIGSYSSSLASDYCFGTNHVLPTSTFARSRGSLSCLDFLRLATRAYAKKEGLERIIGHIKTISEAEGLPNHAKAVEARL